MLKKYLIPINFFLSILAAVLLFFAVRIWVSPNKPGEMKIAEGLTGEQETELHLKKRLSSKKTFDLISQKNLFRPDRKAWVPPPPPPSPPPRPAASATVTVAPQPVIEMPDLDLKGIIYSERSKYVFIDGMSSITIPEKIITEVYEISGVKRTRTKKIGGKSTSKLTGKKHFRLNERIANYFTVAEIHKDRVILTTDNGEKVELKMKLKKKSAKITPKKSAKKVKKSPPKRTAPKISGS